MLKIMTLYCGCPKKESKMKERCKMKERKQDERMKARCKKKRINIST